MIYVDSKACTGCGVCQAACPENAIIMREEIAYIEESRCDECELCLDACPQGAILAVELVEHEALSPVPVPESIIPPTRVDEQLPARRSALLDLALPAIGSALVWTGREIVPRLASLGLDLLDRRARNSAPSAPAVTTSVVGRATNARRAGRGRQGRKQRQRRRHAGGR